MSSAVSIVRGRPAAQIAENLSPHMSLTFSYPDSGRFPSNYEAKYAPQYLVFANIVPDNLR
jgi:hypothetical protein